MHHYQKHILDLLRASKRLQYSKLQPPGVESSHFKYHLDQLLQDDLVVRIDRGIYGLTTKGRMAVDRLSERRVNPHQTPKVITYTLLQKDDKYHVYRKRKEPFLGTLNMVSGKVHLGETSHDAALREVHEKAGVHAQDLEQRLIAEVRIRESDALVSHFIAYVFTARLENKSGDLEAYTPEELVHRDDIAPDLTALLHAIHTWQTSVSLDCSF